MAHLRALVFDLDGTLIHSAPDLQLSANEALEALGRPPLDLPTIVSFIGNGIETLMRRCLEATGGADDAQREAAIRIFLDVYAENVTTHTRPYQGVVAALEHFASHGIRLGICTNKPTEPARNVCERLDLARYFDVIVGAQEGQPKKPDPASLLTCLSALGATRDTALYVGDSTVDYHTALKAEVPFRLFSGGYLNAPLPDLRASDRFDDWADHGIMFS